MKKIKIEKIRKPTAKQKLISLQAEIDNFLSNLRHRNRDNFQIAMKVKDKDGKDCAFNVPSLLASVLTAQNFGKEVRLEAAPAPDGGTLYVRFYDPVSTAGLR